MNRFKERVLREIINLGRKNDGMRMPAIVLLAVFLTLYHAVRDFFLQFRYHPVRQRVLAGILILALLSGQMFPNVFAVTDAGVYGVSGSLQISAFAKLPEEVQEQVVPVGTDMDKLTFPNTLEAFVTVEYTDTVQVEEESLISAEPVVQDNIADGTCATGDAEPEYSGTENMTTEAAAVQETTEAAATSEKTNTEKTEIQETRTQTETINIQGVTWTAKTEYDKNTEGTYIFTAVLPEGYALTEGVSLPQITVTVCADSAKEAEAADGGEISLLMRPLDENNSSDMVYYMEDNFESYSWEVYTGEEWQEIGEYEPELVVSKEDWYTYRFRCIAKKEGFFYTANAKDDWQENMGIMLMSENAAGSGQSNYMYYSNTGTYFNIKGIDNGNLIQTTYADRGYRTLSWVDGGGNVDWGSDREVAMGKSLYGSREISLVYNGRYAKIKYMVTNRGSSTQSFKVGSSADVMIGNNDYAPVVGSSSGLVMSGSPKNSYTFNLVAPTVNTLWYGFFSKAHDNTFTNLADRSKVYESDSGMAWSWSGTVAPGQTWSRYVLLGVGELPPSPNAPKLTNQRPMLKSDVPTVFTGTADPGNTVSIEVGGEEFTGTADDKGNFSVTVVPPRSLPEGETDINCYAVSPDGGISDVQTVKGTVTISPYVVLTDAETSVTEDSVLNDAWYRKFIGSSNGTVSCDAASVNTGTPGTYTVNYKAVKTGCADAKATLKIKVLPLPLELSSVTATRVSGYDSFTLSASLNHTGGETISETGFVWGAMQNPTLALNNGSKRTDSVIKTKGGALTVKADDIVDGVTYYARAYVKTSDGSIHYSPQQSFSIDGKTYGTFNIVNNNNNTFTVTRSGGTNEIQTVYFRTVNGSAIGGTHFEHKVGKVTFNEGQESQDITITEMGATKIYGGKVTTAYSNVNRTYQVEIYRVDGGGTLGNNTKATREMPKDENYTVDKSIYEWQTVNGPQNEKERGDYDDDKLGWTENKSYPEAKEIVSIKETLLTGKREYWTNTAQNLYYYITFDAKEYESGYQAFQIAPGTSIDLTAYPYQGVLYNSLYNAYYMVLFEHGGSGKQTDWASYTFPRSSGNTQAKNNASHMEGDYVLFDVNEQNISVGYGAAGNKSDKWATRYVKHHFQIKDEREPQLLGVAPMAGSTYKEGEKVVISLVFDEIVDSDNSRLDSVTLDTSWGDFTYKGGADTNVLYFEGTVTSGVSGQLTINSITGAENIKDMCSGSKTASGGSGSVSIDVDTKAPSVSIINTYILNKTAYATITATNADTIKYTWSKNATMPLTGWLDGANMQVVSTRQDSGTWYLHVLATYNATGKTNHKAASFDFNNSSSGAMPELTLSADNSTWARTRTINLTKQPSTGTVTVKTPQGATFSVTGSSYTAEANGSYTFTFTAPDGEKVVKSIMVSKIDRSAPKAVITGPDDRIQNENVKLTVTPTDEGGSGVKTVTGTWARKTNGGSVQTIEAPLTKNADGTYSAVTSGTDGNKYTYLLSVKVTDNAGNSATVMDSSAYTVNLKAPVVTVIRTGTGKAGDTYSYTVNANDNTITSVSLPDNTITTNLSGTFTLTSPGTYYVTVSDEAGHVVRSSAMKVAEDVDGDAPIVRVFLKDENWTSEAKLDVSVYEEGSIASAVWKKEGAASATTLKYSLEEASVYSGNFSVTQNGTYTVTVTDANGNVGTDSVTVSNIDRTKPEVTCTACTAANTTTGWYTDENVQIKLTFADKTGAEGGTPSGIKTVQYKPVTGETATPVKPADGLLSLDSASPAFKNGEFTYNISGNGKYYLYYKVTDNKGNVTDGFSELIKKDSCGESAVIIGPDEGQPETDGLDMSIKLTHGPSGGTLYAGMVANFVISMLAGSEVNDTELATISGYGGMDVAKKTITKNYNDVRDTGRHYFRYYNNASGTSSYWYFYVYSITFDSQDGNAADTQLVWTTQESGSDDTTVQCAIVKPQDPVRNGYTFGGWYTDAACTSGKEFDFSTQVRENTMLYAKWTLNGHSITYDLNGGELAADATNPSEYTFESDDITLNNPIRTGYDFKGWSGTDLTGDENTDVTIAKGSKGNRSYTANWTPKTYTVTFDYQNATGGNDMENKTVIYDSTYGILPEPERTGYNFKGWYTEENGGAEVTDTTTVKTAHNHTIYAHWKDETAPAALVLPSDVSLPTDWTRTQDIIPLVLHDDAGVTELFVSIDGGEYEKVENFDGGTEYNYVAKEGEHTYRFKAKDASGNTSDESEEFKIKLDTTSPEITVSADRKPTDEEAQPDDAELSESWYDSAPSITVTVKDNKAGEGTGTGGTEGTDTAGVTSVSYYIGDTEYPVTVDGVALQGQTVFTIPANMIPEGEMTITVKAKDGAGNEKLETIKVKVKIPEEMPEAKIDYEAQKLTGLVPNETYTVTYTDENGIKCTEDMEATAGGAIQLKEAWKGKDITVNKKGNGNDKKDGEGQSLSIPKSPDKPNAGNTDASYPNAQDGSITGLDASLTYEIRVKDENGNFTEWKDAVLDGTEIKNLSAGEYEVRVKAVENVSLPGEAIAITIGAHKPAEINPPKDDKTQADSKPVTDDNQQTDGKPTSDDNQQADGKPVTDDNQQTDGKPVTDDNQQTDGKPMSDDNQQADGRPTSDDTDNVDETGKTKVSASGEKDAKCGLCHICPRFLGICCFIWLAVIVAVFLIIGVVIWKKKKEKVK